jgi:hypothetical protein
MKKVMALSLVLFAFGCGRGYYTSNPVQHLKSTSSATTAATCDNAIIDNVAEAKLEQDPTVDDATACQNRKSFAKKYQGLTCDFPKTPVGKQTLPAATTKIQTMTCDAATVASVAKERAPYLVSQTPTTTTANPPAPVTIPASTSQTK